MGTYKITFIYNQIARISLATGEHNFEGEYYYHSNVKGFLIYAFIKAEDEKRALILADEIIKKSHLNHDNI